MAEETEKKEPVVLLDTTRIPEHSEVVELCECNDWEVPEEDSEKWWDIANTIKEDELEFFKEDADLLGGFGDCLAVGSAGLWYGRVAGGTFLTVDKSEDLFYLVSNCDDIKVSIDPDEGLTVTGYHHDGENEYVVRKLTDKGRAFREENEFDMEPRELHAQIFDDDTLSTKITLE